MKILAVVCASAVGVYFVLLTCFVEHETFLKEFFAAAAGLAVLILAMASLIWGLVSCERYKFNAFIPCLICLLGVFAGFVGAIEVGESIKSANFKKNLPRYNEVVDLINQGEIKPDADGHVQLPAQFTDLAYSVFIRFDSGGRLVIFDTDRAFPLDGSAYIYTASGRTNQFISGRNCIKQVNPNWFYVSD